MNESSTAQSELEIPSTSASTSDDATTVISTMEPVTTTTRQAFMTSTPDIRDSPTTDTLLVTEEPKANISTVL
jgi:hypothetical protein